MKTCTKCKVSKPESEYNPKVKGQPALRAICKACASARVRERYVDTVLYEWNDTSIMCYERKGICKGCFFEHYFSDGHICQMRYHAKKVLERVGKPKEWTYDMV